MDIVTFYVSPTNLIKIYLLPACVLSPSGNDLRDPMDCSPPGSSVHGILQARILA